MSMSYENLQYLLSRVNLHLDQAEASAPQKTSINLKVFFIQLFHHLKEYQQGSFEERNLVFSEVLRAIKEKFLISSTLEDKEIISLFIEILFYELKESLRSFTDLIEVISIFPKMYHEKILNLYQKNPPLFESMDDVSFRTEKNFMNFIQILKINSEDMRLKFILRFIPTPIEIFNYSRFFAILDTLQNSGNILQFIEHAFFNPMIDYHPWGFWPSMIALSKKITENDQLALMVLIEQKKSGLKKFEYPFNITSLAFMSFSYNDAKKFIFENLYHADITHSIFDIPHESWIDILSTLEENDRYLLIVKLNKDRSSLLFLYSYAFFSLLNEKNRFKLFNDIGAEKLLSSTINDENLSSFLALFADEDRLFILKTFQALHLQERLKNPVFFNQILVSLKPKNRIKLIPIIGEEIFLSHFKEVSDPEYLINNTLSLTPKNWKIIFLNFMLNEIPCESIFEQLKMHLPEFFDTLNIEVLKQQAKKVKIIFSNIKLEDVNANIHLISRLLSQYASTSYVSLTWRSSLSQSIANEIKKILEQYINSPIEECWEMINEYVKPYQVSVNDNKTSQEKINPDGTFNGLLMAIESLIYGFSFVVLKKKLENSISDSTGWFTIFR
jgi:hypothetical protein